MMPALPRDSEWLLRGLASGVGSGPLVLARRQPVSPRHALQGSLFLAVVFSTLYTADLAAVVFSNYQYCYFASCCIAGRSLSLSSRFAVSCGLLQWVVGLQWCRLFVLKAEVVACCAPLASAGPGYVYHV